MRLHIPLVSASLLALSVSALTAAPVAFNWLTCKGKAMIQIAECGSGLYGQIVRVKQALEWQGQPVRDERNRDASLRGREVLGLTMFSGHVATGPRSWTRLMYNPGDGRTCRGTLTLADRTRILIRSCWTGGSIFGERIWVRAQQQERN
jgi:uncharacterized protein (DUF2147 family)